MTNIISLDLSLESDLVMARQRTRQLAELLGFKVYEQTSIATAVSEIARNAFQYAGGGKVEFLVQGSPQVFLIRISDRGRGIYDLEAILNGNYTSKTGMGLGIIGAKRLTDHFHIESIPAQGTTVILGKQLPSKTPIVKGQYLAQIAQALAQRNSSSLFDEMQRQNQELLNTLAEIRAKQAELEQLNKELEETNRGVVALYAELDDKAEYLQRGSKLKSHFLADMSHEFRTPLNSILSLSGLLLDRTDGDLSSEQEKQVNFIRNSAEILSELVNNLLDIAKIEAGKIVVNPSQFSIDDVFSALRGMFRPLITSDNISLVFEDPIDIPKLYTDEGKVSQILRNFISNAVKFTEQGEVRVSAKLDSNNNVVFSISDTGLGIAPEDQQRIFEQFIQIESPTQNRVKGTGLGLPLCLKLAELLGGNVSVESELGVGSTFVATIPLQYSLPKEELVSSEMSWMIDSNRYPVLVVEDNLETLFIYEKYLENSPFQVIPARTLQEARKALWEVRPRVIILDLLLEIENTWAFISEIKENSFTQHIPVIVLTVIDNRTKAIALGADDFCVKPVEKKWLLEKLTTLIEQKPLEKILIIDDDPT
ncbi:MAG TPA: ATP-binding protein, partial [Bacillales bacterium]|nr:ATP-binding protein [Bacillales bacterium]